MDEHSTATTGAVTNSITLEDIQRAKRLMENRPPLWCTCNVHREINSLVWICPLHGNKLGDLAEQMVKKLREET